MGCPTVWHNQLRLGRDDFFGNLPADGELFHLCQSLLGRNRRVGCSQRLGNSILESNVRVCDRRMVSDSKRRWTRFAARRG